MIKWLNTPQKYSENTNIDPGNVCYKTYKPLNRVKEKRRCITAAALMCRVLPLFAIPGITGSQVIMLPFHEQYKPTKKIDAKNMLYNIFSAPKYNQYNQYESARPTHSLT